MTTDEQCFLDDINTAPADLTTRLVYADWLADRGRTAEEAGWRWAAAAGLTPVRTEGDCPETYPPNPNTGSSRYYAPSLPPRSAALAGRVELRWRWFRSGYPARDWAVSAVLPDPVVAVYVKVPPREISSRSWRVLRDEGWLWWARTPAGSLRLLAALYRNCPPVVKRQVSGWRGGAASLPV